MIFYSDGGMQRFFPDFESLDRFTFSLGCFAEQLPCPHCAKCHQLVSHGVIYKQRSMNKREPVGKRVFCSNRYQHQGCGRTVQLYVATVTPKRQYAVAAVLAFVSALLREASVSAAYQTATGQANTRQAWRWLNNLMHRLTDFRTHIHRHVEPAATAFDSRCRRLRLLLPTLQRLFAQLPANPGTHYQLHHQQALF